MANGYTGSESQWLASLVGRDGKDGINGTDGKDGVNGINGKDGVGVKNAYIDENKNLIFELTDGTTINAGSLADSAATKYTVVFKDYDGTVLKTCTVEKGGSATAPAAPTRSGYTFDGWDKDFSNVTSNLIVTAKYVKAGVPVFEAQSVTASAGETIKVPVVIKNNPGIAGAKITISFDSNLTLTGAEAGEAFSGLTYMGPGKFVSPCNFSWDAESDNVYGNGNVVILTFKVSDSAKSGDSFTVNVSYVYGDIYDADFNDIQCETSGGTVTIK